MVKEVFYNLTFIVASLRKRCIFRLSSPKDVFIGHEKMKGVLTNFKMKKRVRKTCFDVSCCRKSFERWADKGIPLMTKWLPEAYCIDELMQGVSRSLSQTSYCICLSHRWANADSFSQTSCYWKYGCLDRYFDGAKRLYRLFIGSLYRVLAD